MKYFLDLYGTLPRAGPGSNELTRRAFGMMPHVPGSPRILDLGCGPGMQTVALLRMTDGTVLALDFLPHMIERAKANADSAGVSARLETLVQDMKEIDTVAAKLEVIQHLGYDEVGHFIFPPEAWTEQYYDPMEARNEISVFRQYCDYFGYAFFVMRKSSIK